MVGCESVCIESKKSWIFWDEPAGGAGAEELACVGAEVEAGAAALGVCDWVAAIPISLLPTVGGMKLIYQVEQAMEFWPILDLLQHPDSSCIPSCYLQSLDHSSIPPVP